MTTEIHAARAIRGVVPHIFHLDQDDLQPEWTAPMIRVITSGKPQSFQRDRLVTYLSNSFGGDTLAAQVAVDEMFDSLHLMDRPNGTLAEMLGFKRS